MDGLPEILAETLSDTRQRTLRASIGCVGTGVHSGQRVSVTLRPAEAGHGIVFRRADLGIDIPARFDRVTDTRLCTVLASAERPEARVGTVEHLMAALAGCGVDNILIEVDGPELPILDGSAAPFAFLLDCAGIVALDAERTRIDVLRTVRVDDGEAFAELRPGRFGFDLDCSIDFADAAIGQQSWAMRLSPAGFRAELARARTFGLLRDVERLKAAGLARGGSLDNAVVVDGGQVLNPAGLRMDGEFVRHKMLDAIGDLALAGAPLCARFVSHRGGHALNNRVLRALFADRSAWRASAPVGSGGTVLPLQAAAAPA